MDGHEERKRAQQTAIIRNWNDEIRRSGMGGKIVLTRGVASLSVDCLRRLLRAVQRFDAFTPDNDPWGEHDFGQVVLDDEPYFWKIDAYDFNLEFGSPDPADRSVTRRVLTIMTAHEV